MTTQTEPAPFRHVTDVEAEYYKRNPDGHFFDRDTKRFFRSRTGAIVAQSEQCVYFLTSEKGPHNYSPRRYTARVMDTDGNIESVGKFNEHTRTKAQRLAEQAAQHQFTARELGNGGCAISCILDAKRYWEEDGGTITDRVIVQRDNAAYWAALAGWRIEWTSLTPHIHRNGQDYMLSDIVPFID